MTEDARSWRLQFVPWALPALSAFCWLLLALSRWTTWFGRHPARSWLAGLCCLCIGIVFCVMLGKRGRGLWKSRLGIAACALCLVVALVLPGPPDEGATARYKKLRTLSVLRSLHATWHSYAAPNGYRFPKSPVLSRSELSGMLGGVLDPDDLAYVSGLRADDPPETVLAFMLAPAARGPDTAYVLFVCGMTEERSDSNKLRETVKQQLGEIEAHGRQCHVLWPGDLRMCE